MKQRCATKCCLVDAEFRVLWPGQPTVMCLAHAHNAVMVAKHMGFDLPVVEMDWVSELKKLVDAVDRLGGPGTFYQTMLEP